MRTPFVEIKSLTAIGTPASGCVSSPLSMPRCTWAARSKASFCVIAQDDVVPALYTTRYRSVIAFGTIRQLEDEQAMITALDVLGRKYAPDLDPSAEIAGSLHRVCVLEMTIDHLTGKEGIELTRLREKKQA